MRSLALRTALAAASKWISAAEFLARVSSIGRSTAAAACCSTPNPTVEGIAAIAAAHRRAGVTAFLPTVVTDAPRVLAAALAAAREARERVPGALGIHVEGPFIDPKRKGVHPPQFIRPMLEQDADALIAARAGVMVVTLAPASVSMDFIARLAKAGIIVSLGHSDATRRGSAGRIRRRRERRHPSL